MEKTELEKKLEAEAQAEFEAEERITNAEFADENGDGPIELEAELVDLDVDVEALLGERDELQAQCDELKDQLLRARAEFDNYRKRMVREADRTRKMAAEALIRDLLEVVDNLELATQHGDDASGGLAEGVQMVLRQFRETLARQGLEAIETKDQPFNPEIHEAVMQTQSDTHKEGLVVQEFQKGYRLGDVVLRPSRVVVSTGPGTGDAADQPERTESSSGDSES